MATLQKNFKEKQPVVSRVIDKKTVQGILKDFRNTEDFTVTKLDSGYTVHHVNPKNSKQSTLMFKAMDGARGYLCRFDERIFS